jgi:hypothetical protein
VITEKKISAMYQCHCHDLAIYSMGKFSYMRGNSRTQRFRDVRTIRV